MFAPADIADSTLSFNNAKALLKSLRQHDAMRVIKTWVNSWATSGRFQGQRPSWCFFGCERCKDEQKHYAQCSVLYELQCMLCSDLSSDPLVRLGVKDPAIKYLKITLCQ